MGGLGPSRWGASASFRLGAGANSLFKSFVVMFGVEWSVLGLALYPPARPSGLIKGLASANACFAFWLWGSWVF